jgi:hypothetical protein
LSPLELSSFQIEATLVKSLIESSGLEVHKIGALSSTIYKLQVIKTELIYSKACTVNKLLKNNEVSPRSLN